MNPVAAWLLNFGGGRLAAVGLSEVLHVTYSPQVVAVPQTPPHCSRVLVIEDRVLPAWDVAAWLGTAAPERTAALGAIVAYRSGRSSAVQFGALLIAKPPLRIMVSDADACELPPAPKRWRAIAMSCVKHDDELIPILDLSWMFSDALSAGRLRSSPEVERVAEFS